MPAKNPCPSLISLSISKLNAMQTEKKNYVLLVFLRKNNKRATFNEPTTSG